MPKFLPVAAAIIGLLCFSAPTLAEDTQTSPSEWHTSWETIQADDIHHYVEQALSDKYYGVYAWGAGRLHRLQEPILFSNAWMECRKFVDENLIIYKKHSGLSIGNKYEYSDFYKSEVSTTGINSFSDIRLKLRFLNEEIIKIYEDDFIDDYPIISDSFINNKNSKSVITFINNEAKFFTTCEKFSMALIHSMITNSYFYLNSTNLTDLDYLFTMALYDPSISPTEPLDSAKPKIIELMLERLSHRQ